MAAKPDVAGARNQRRGRVKPQKVGYVHVANVTDVNAKQEKIKKRCVVVANAGSVDVIAKQNTGVKFRYIAYYISNIIILISNIIILISNIIIYLKCHQE